MGSKAPILMGPPPLDSAFALLSYVFDRRRSPYKKLRADQGKRAYFYRLVFAQNKGFLSFFFTCTSSKRPRNRCILYLNDISMLYHLEKTIKLDLTIDFSV